MTPEQFEKALEDAVKGGRVTVTISESCPEDGCNGTLHRISENLQCCDQCNTVFGA
jgi:DnaJ-class molecular chaperone